MLSFLLSFFCKHLFIYLFILGVVESSAVEVKNKTAFWKLGRILGMKQHEHYFFDTDKVLCGKIHVTVNSTPQWFKICRCHSKEFVLIKTGFIQQNLHNSS